MQTLASCLALNGVLQGSAEAKADRRERAGTPDANRVLAYIRKHPGSGSSEICGEFGTDAASLRTVLHRLRDEGQVKVAGKARATRYTAKK